MSKMPANYGQINDRLKLQHSLAKHSDKDMSVAEQAAQMLFSSSLSASRLSPGMRVNKRMPPYQQLANLEAAIAATKCTSHNINGLPASQSAIAAPLGTVQNKLMTFGQFSTLTGRQR